MKALLGCVIFSFALISCASNGLSLNVDANASSFVVTLPANPTTGFQWSVVRFDKNLLKLTSSTFEKPKTNLIGAGGQMYFTFSLQKGKSYPVSTKIQFKYARSWEPGSGEMKNVTVHFIKK